MRGDIQVMALSDRARQEMADSLTVARRRLNDDATEALIVAVATLAGLGWNASSARFELLRQSPQEYI